MNQVTIFINAIIVLLIVLIVMLFTIYVFIKNPSSIVLRVLYGSEETVIRKQIIIYKIIT